jgi:hypothetical protein
MIHKGTRSDPREAEQVNRMTRMRSNFSKDKTTIKRYFPWIVLVALITALASVIPLLRPSEVEAQQYPILDMVANKLILKYEQASCQQLQQKEQQKAPPSPAELKAVQFLHSDPQMRVAFINKVAPPIANKMFDCGLIP